MSWRVLATLLLIAWGALAFGAVYPWAFTPLFAGCAIVGIASAIQHHPAGRIEPTVALSVALSIAAIGSQLIPLPADTIRRISPETDLFLQRHAFGYLFGERHPLSVVPRSTMIALTAAISFGLFFLGLSRALTREDVLRICKGVIVLGVAMALIGMAQQAMWNGKIYGFWTPYEMGAPFGPFVNHNHFAGWMLMALPLTIGYFCSRMARGMRQVKDGWRNRVIWLSSADASETMLVGLAMLVMTVGLTLTYSRSGVLGLVAALIICGWFAAKWQANASRRALTIGCLALVGWLAISWAGWDRLAARFTERDSGPAGRVAIWTDTWRMAERFPIAGTGLNTFADAIRSYQTSDPGLFAEAHNDYLQLLAEGGVLVGVPIAMAIGVIGWTIRRRFRDASVEDSDYWIRIGATTGIVAIALQEVADFSLQMPGNAALFAVLLALSVRRSGPARRAIRGTP
jgi:O-antigen ligase